MKIYTIRHGYTNMNKQHLYNGQIDEDINEYGIKGAEEAREQLKDIKFDIIYCSPMIRAKHTCEIININKVPVIFDDRLKERTLGKLDGKNLKEEINKLKDNPTIYAIIKDEILKKREIRKIKVNNYIIFYKV